MLLYIYIYIIPEGAMNNLIPLMEDHRGGGGAWEPL